LATSTGAAERS